METNASVREAPITAVTAGAHHDAPTDARSEPAERAVDDASAVGHPFAAIAGAPSAGTAGRTPRGENADGALLAAADVLLVYDGECPACDNYCRVMRIREDVGRLVIVDAREDTPIMREITAAGLDIDNGMVLRLGDELYYGSDAIHMLALIGSRSGILNRLNYHLFRSSRVAHRLYPVLRTGRAVLLRLLGKTRINNLGLENNERF